MEKSHIVLNMRPRKVNKMIKRLLQVIECQKAYMTAQNKKNVFKLMGYWVNTFLWANMFWIYLWRIVRCSYFFFSEQNLAPATKAAINIFLKKFRYFKLKNTKCFAHINISIHWKFYQDRLDNNTNFYCEIIISYIVFELKSISYDSRLHIYK